MKTKKIKVRQGFTIVELVIVIGVIGVLTAVLVPTFINLNKKAEEASNQSFVKNLNTQMAIREQEEGKNNTMFEAVEDAKGIGFDVEKLTPVNGRDLVWDSVANRFALLNEDGTEFYTDGGLKGQGDKIWKIYDSMPTGDQKFSIYARTGWSTKNVTGLTVGFDAGYNTKIETVSYANTVTAKDVVIRTNGGKLIINDTLDGSHQYHYGNAASAEVTTGAHCYEGHAIVSAMKISAGKVIVAEGAYVGVTEATEGVTLTEQGTGVVVIPENVTPAQVPASVASQVGYEVEDGSFVPTPAKEAKSYYVIEKETDLTNFVDGWNGGNDLIKTVKFAENVAFDFTEHPWTPLGTWEHPFNGVIDGMGCSIKGLGVIENTVGQGTSGSTTGISGQAYGFIGIAGNGDVTVSNINFVDLNIDHADGNMVGAVIGFAPSNEKFKESSASAKWVSDAEVGTDDVTISNITVSGSIRVKQDGAAIAGKLYNSGKQIIKKCVNNASIESTQDGNSSRAGGIVSMVSNSDETLIENCVNKGSVTSHGYACGILGYASKTTGVIQGCRNEGVITGRNGYTGDIWNSACKTGNPSITIK